MGVDKKDLLDGAASCLLKSRTDYTDNTDFVTDIFLLR